jgi:hypothetical protein
METLQKDWLIDGLIDFEYKKYILLAYLQDIKKNFNDSKLYPFLSDLVFHHKNLVNIKESKELLRESFPKSISKADFQKLKITYEKIVQDDQVMAEIESILGFAIPMIKDTLEGGKELFEFVELNLEISPIGLTPLYTNEGYIFLQIEKKSDVMIYRYQTSVFTNSIEQYRSINTTFVSAVTRSISNTFENIKVNLAKQFSFLPNPASYLVHSKLHFPISHTLLPVAKRMLIKQLVIV